MRPEPARNQRIAFHEASHCVVARRLRVPLCGGATIVEPNAHTVFSNNFGTASVCALMAGRAAELVAFGDYERVGSLWDWERVSERLERHGYDETALWQETMSLVREHLGCIEFLAGMLARAGTLDGRTIDRIVG